VTACRGFSLPSRCAWCFARCWSVRFARPALCDWAYPGSITLRLMFGEIGCAHRIDESRDLPACASRGRFVGGVWRSA